MNIHEKRPTCSERNNSMRQTEIHQCRVIFYKTILIILLIVDCACPISSLYIMPLYSACEMRIGKQWTRKKELGKSCPSAPFASAGSYKPNAAIFQASRIKRPQGHAHHHLLYCQVYARPTQFHQYGTIF